MKISSIALPLVCSLALFLGACSDGGNSYDFSSGAGGDSSGDTPGTTTISGTAEAPAGVVALLERRSLFIAAMDVVFTPVSAGIIGLQPVGGAAVQLIRIDNDGNQVGDVLAETVTSITGDYSLVLPEGVSLAANLVVRITGNNVSMGAMVVDQAVNINPVSQYVLKKFVDTENLVLADLPLNEIVSLQGKVDEFDLTATGDISSMLAKIEADLGELVETEIAVIQSTPDDGTAAAAAAGDWNSVEMSLSFSDSEQEDFGTFSMDLFSSSLTVAAGNGAGQLNITENQVLLDVDTHLSVDANNFANLHHEVEIGSDSVTFPATLDADGNLTVEEPFEEELQTVTIGDQFTDPEADGPDYGWRMPAGTFRADDTGNRNTLVHLSTGAEVRYGTADTDGNSIKDAIDPDAKQGDEVDLDLLLVLKAGADQTAGSLDGAYGIVTLLTESMIVEGTMGPGLRVSSTVGAVSASAGTVTVAAGALDEVGFTRQAIALNQATLEDFTIPDGDFTVPYTVSANGRMTLDTDLEGWLNEDGSLFGLLSVNTTGEFTLTAVEHELLLGLKLAAATPDLDGAVYKLYPMVIGADAAGGTELSTLARSSSLTFDIDTMTAATDFRVRGYARATDVSGVTAITDTDDSIVDFSIDSLGANGKISMSAAGALGDATTLDGFVSADGKLMLMRFHDADDTGGVSRLLGIMLAIRQ